MRRCFRTVTLVIILFAGPAAAAPTPDVKLPPGTRMSDGELVSTRGLRDTTDFLAKELDRRGIAVTQIGPTRTRGVELVRFLSQVPTTPWLAIHVMRTNGKTVIFFVLRTGPAAALDETERGR